MMDRLDDELRNALRREEPPPGFAERVLTAAKEAEAARPGRIWDWFRMPALRWALATAACLALIVGALAVRREREMRARGEAAKAQVMLALRITGSKLHMVQAKVERIGEGRQRPARPLERQL